jgi:hypothetical protein
MIIKLKHFSVSLPSSSPSTLLMVRRTFFSQASQCMYTFSSIVMLCVDRKKKKKKQAYTHGGMKDYYAYLCRASGFFVHGATTDTENFDNT